MFLSLLTPAAAAPEREPGRPGTNAGARVGDALATVAERLHMPFAGDARALVRRDEVRRHAIWQDPPLHADGLPVVLVGGMTATPVMLAVLQDWLRRLGCRTVIAPTRLGVGCGEEATLAVAQAVRAHADASGAAPVVIAHSRGGQFARAAAVRDPEAVRGLITLGSPLSRLTDVHPLLRLEIYALGLAGTLGVPGLFRAGCLWGECCRRLRGEIAGPFPERVPFLSVYSRLDGMVDWRACLDAGARHCEVRASHGGLVADPDVFAVIATELGRLLGGPASAPEDSTAA
jgi:triacylglycerol lipase